MNYSFSHTFRNVVSLPAGIFLDIAGSIQPNFLDVWSGVTYCFRKTEIGMLMAWDRSCAPFIAPNMLEETVQSICRDNYTPMVRRMSTKSIRDVGMWIDRVDLE